MNWYRISQLDPKNIDYLSIGHHDMQVGKHVPALSSNIKKECLWIMDKNWKIQSVCKDVVDQDEYHDPFDESEFQHSEVFDPNAVFDAMAQGRYVEYYDKEPVASMVMNYDIRNSMLGARKTRKVYDEISRYFGTNIVYEF